MTDPRSHGLAVVAAATIAARLPFLLRADRFFDSDEAVEGLMARHVLLGEHPLFLWGQRYKGVPEVYLSAAVFHWMPSTAASVVALKAVTLACFAVFVCLNFWLLTRLFNRRISWIATSLLIVCPPSLVLWSLSGSAEIVMSLIAGTVLCLGIDAWRRSGSRAGLAAAAAALGFGLWIQQYILYYVVALAVAAIDLTPQGRARLRELVAARMLPAWVRLALRLQSISRRPLHRPWHRRLSRPRLRRHAARCPDHGDAPAEDVVDRGGVAAGERRRLDRRTAGVERFEGNPARVAGAGARFSRGLLAGARRTLLSDGVGAPMARMDLAGLRSAMSPFVRIALPIVFGFKSPTTEPLAVPAWSALIIGGALVVSYIAECDKWQTEGRRRSRRSSMSF